MLDNAAPLESANSAVDRPWSRGAVAWVGVVMVLAVVVYWPALQVRYFADDYIQIAKLEGLLGPHHPAGLYSFFADNPAEILAHRARGSLPWWTVDDFRFVHVRPLASLLLELDHAIAPRAAWLHHLHSMGWLVAMLGTLALLLRRSTTPAIAAAALLIFALDETLAWTVAWVANRCAMITATFVFGALAVHMKRRDNPSPRGWWVEFVCWLVALSAGEYAVCGLAYLASYAVWGRDDALVSRARALLPAALALAVFAAVYLWSGAGVSGGTSYIDPFHETSRFLDVFVERASRAAGEVWLSIPGETEQLWNRYYDTPLPKLLVLWNQARTTLSLEHAHGRFSFGAVALILVTVWVLARGFLTQSERRTVAWTTVGSFLSLIPLAATPPVTRTLALAGLGPAVFIGAVLLAATRAWRADRPQATSRRLLRWMTIAALYGLTAALLFQHTVNDARWSRKHIARLSGLGGAFEGFFLSSHIKDLDLAGKHVVVVAGPELVTSFYGQWIMNVVDGPMPDTWHTLSMGPRRYIVRRHGRNKLELSALGQPILVSSQETLFRKPSEVLNQGESVDVGLFRAQIVSELAWQGPNAVMFEFDRPLSDPSLVFLVAGEQGLEPFSLPQPGRAIALPLPIVPHDESLDTAG